MRHRLLLVPLVLCLALAACSGDDDAEVSPEVQAAADDTTPPAPVEIDPCGWVTAAELEPTFGGAVTLVPGSDPAQPSCVITPVDETGALATGRPDATIVVTGTGDLATACESLGAEPEGDRCYNFADQSTSAALTYAGFTVLVSAGQDGGAAEQEVVDGIVSAITT